MAWWNHTRQKLTEALAQIESLKTRLDNHERENTDLRRMLQLKNEECEYLLNRCRHMQDRSDYADTLEAKVAELQQQLDNCTKLTENYTRKIDRLRMERDEARAMLKAHDESPDTILPIDFSILPATSQPTTPATSRPQKNPPSRHNRHEAPQTPDADSDWYKPLPDNL